MSRIGPIGPLGTDRGGDRRAASKADRGGVFQAKGGSYFFKYVTEMVFIYYLKKYVALLIRKTINAVTVMFAVMKIIQQIINAVTVIPVKMYQTISKHIMFRCHCRFLLEI